MRQPSCDFLDFAASAPSLSSLPGPPRGMMLFFWGGGGLAEKGSDGDETGRLAGFGASPVLRNILRHNLATAGSDKAGPCDCASQRVWPRSWPSLAIKNTLGLGVGARSSAKGPHSLVRPTSRSLPHPGQRHQ